MKIPLYRCFYILILIAMVPISVAQDSPSITLTLLGEQQIETGTIYEDTEVGGLSGITYNADEEVFYAISDDRSALAPARFYTLELEISNDAFDGVQFTDVITLLQEDGTPFPRNSIDPEAIRYISSSGHIMWSSESNAQGVPTVWESNLDGSFVREYDVPDYYLPDGESGVRDNIAFEALALSSDEQFIYVGTENALLQDGDAATLEAGSLSRILVIERETGDVAAEYIYETGPIPVSADPPTTTQDNGLVALLPYGDDDTQLLAVERSFVLGVGNTIGIYLVDFTDATNITGENSINEINATPAAKTHILTIEEGTFGLDIDNIEGATWGPLVENRQTLVLVSDNNFNAPAQMFTQFLVFTVGE